MREFLWFQSKQCHLVVCPSPGCQGDGNNICRNALLSPTMGSMFADLLLADDMTSRPLIGQTTAWHLGCWHEVCEVWITQIYRRKHDTWDLEIRGQRGDKNTPFLNPRPRCLYHVNLKYSQVCGGTVIVDWSIAEITDSHCLPDLVSCQFSLKSQLETLCW